MFNPKPSDGGRRNGTHSHTNINIFMLTTEGNNGKDRTRTLAMMGRIWAGQEVRRKEEEAAAFHVLLF